jgi:nanoRNase/pAp phosphatase (c-di-AMP/oligoRNAs hydrolase)
MRALAEILLMGLLFDTGSFTFLRPENSNVFDMAKVLLTTANCEIQEFKSRYATTSLRVFSVIQEFMKNSQFIEVSGWPKAMVSFVSSDFKDKEKYLDSEIKWGGLSYLSEYVRNIQDYPWGFIVYPKTAGTGSVSCRSLPRSVNVRDFMERFLGGGGHDRAAGCNFKDLQPEECVEKLKQWMATNTPVLS